MIIDSVSSSRFFSSSAAIDSIFKATCSCRLSDLRTAESRSSSLIAYQRRRTGFISDGRSSDTAETASSTSAEKHGRTANDSPFSASRQAFSHALSIPFPLRADVSTTLQPKREESLSTSILSPFLFTTSIIFSAMTTGFPSSISCVVR